MCQECNVAKRPPREPSAVERGVAAPTGPCVACRGEEGPLETRVVEGHPVRLCVAPGPCRRRWESAVTGEPAQAA